MTKRDLEEMVRKAVLVPNGKGRSAHYELINKWLTNGSNDSTDENGAIGS